MLGVTALVIGGITTAGAQPQPGDDDNGLTANETATLWSKDPDECNAVEERTTAPTEMQALGNCTDITFRRPPETAATWTRNDFASLEAGDSSEAVYPEHAERSSSPLISDAHATIFAIQPSTIAHVDTDETRHYVAPEGELRGFVDYRVSLPAGESASVYESSISEVRLLRDDEVIGRQDGSHKPVIEYDIEGLGSSTLTLEADIDVTIEVEVPGIGNETEYAFESDSLTVSDDLDVEVYDLRASIYHAEYPNEDDGVAIHQALPWHGYQLTEDGNATVRGVWRYYTARDTNWDTLVRNNGAGRETVPSDARPVYVRAYPSQIGPRADPIRDGPDIEQVWGIQSDSPAETLHEDVNIEVINQSYNRSYGVAVRYEDIDRNQIEVEGIVRDVTADRREPEEGSTREIRKSNLTVDIVEENGTAATLEIQLTDANTGNPIILGERVDDPRFEPIAPDSRDGYVSVAGERLQTNASGIATITVREPGSYAVQYHPGSWRTHDPAYVEASSSVTWHPLATASGWLSLFMQAFWVAIPFLVALYAGLRLGSFLKIHENQL